MKRILFLLLALCAFTASAHADLVLREDTASQIVPIGPFVDDTGAPLPLLTISNTDVVLSKNGAAFAAKNSGACTAATGADGMYLCTFDATDSDTVGRLTVYANETGALPVYHEFSVVEEAVYDACCAASAAPLDSTAVQTAAAAALTAYDPPTAAELTSEVSGLLTSQRIITGTCDSGSTTTCVDNALTQADATQLEDRLICFSDSWCALITTFVPGTDTITTTKTAPSTRGSVAYTIFPATLE